MNKENSASHEALLYTLSTDTLLVLNRVSLGLSNKDIAKWSMGWSFTEEKIEKLLSEAYDKLHLKVSKPHVEMRQALCEFMDECRQQELFTPQLFRGADGSERKKEKQEKYNQNSPRGRKAKSEHFEGLDLNSKAFKSTLFQNIRLIAKTRKVSMGAIAEQAGLPRLFLSFLKSGQVAMNLQRLTALSDAVCVRVDFLTTTFLFEGDEILREISHTGK